MRVEMLIDGRWTTGTDTFATYDPATGDVIAKVALGTPADVDAAVAAAARAFSDPGWSRCRPPAAPGCCSAWPI